MLTDLVRCTVVVQSLEQAESWLARFEELSEVAPQYCDNHNNDNHNHNHNHNYNHNNHKNHNNIVDKNNSNDKIFIVIIIIK